MGFFLQWPEKIVIHFFILNIKRRQMNASKTLPIGQKIKEKIIGRLIISLDLTEDEFYQTNRSLESPPHSPVPNPT